jgi:hypothetical protein
VNSNHIDVCNGDADGLCSVVQWRLYAPQAARLVTGLKRDIRLLDRVPAVQGDRLLVCDLSMRRNQATLQRLLEAGVSVRYFDHHAVDAIPVHPLLDAHIDVSSGACTSLVVDRYLGGAFRAWALVGAFGDNLTGVAHALATDLGLSVQDSGRLQALGESINYNAYGHSAQDVHIAPSSLYEILVRYPDPLLLLEHESIGQELDALRQDDLRRARALPPYLQNARGSVYLLPDAPWSRRVSGSLANFLAAAQPLHAHALLTTTAAGDFVVSVRAPLRTLAGAAEFCRQFGGDGRAGAAGIDHLPAAQLERFIEVFSATRWADAPPVPAVSGRDWKAAALSS